jgi:hypothetical protein
MLRKLSRSIRKVAKVEDKDGGKKKEEVSPYVPDLQMQWRKAIGMPLRSPRTGYEEVVNIVNAAWPPTVFMRENRKTTDIIVRLDCSSRQLSDAHKQAYFDNFVPLKCVFDDAISKAPAMGENTIRWKLATEAYCAYKMTWLRLFRSLYLDQFDPRINPPTWLSNVEKVFSSRRPPGRRKKDDDNQLRSRLNLLVDHCERLRRKIDDYLAKQTNKTERDQVHILRTFWKDILKIPGGISILG